LNTEFSFLMEAQQILIIAYITVGYTTSIQQ
jgi:hypothetical protein